MGELLNSFNELKAVIKRDILYHGTLDIYEDSIREGISLERSLDTKDFGKGFYLTTNYELAKTTAEGNSRRHNRRRKNKYNQSNPIVLEFVVNEEFYNKECNILYFDKSDEDWLGFISSNKNPEREICEMFPNKWKGNYPIIYGPLADGVTGYINSVETFEKNAGSTMDFLRIISKGFEFPLKDQIVFKDEVLANEMLSVIEKEGEDLSEYRP